MCQIQHATQQLWDTDNLNEKKKKNNLNLKAKTVTVHPHIIDIQVMEFHRYRNYKTSS